LLQPVCNILQSLLGLNLGIGVSNLIVYAAEADCPVGDVALSGGASTGSLVGLLATSAPTDGGATHTLVTNGHVARGWLGVATGVSSLQAYVICAP
jgi:hypothetical protein